MHFFVLLLLLSLSSASPALRSIEDIVAETKQNFSVTYQRNLLNSDCGGVIQEPNFGQIIQISYKPTDIISANEHCSWRVIMEDIGSYQLILSTSGFPPASRTPSVTSFLHSNFTSTTYIPEIGSEMEIRGHILLVTLHTKPDAPETTGFTLFVLPTNDFNSGVSNRSVHVSLGNNEIVSHPYSGNYFPDEMSTFLMPPMNIPTTQTLFFIQKKLEPVSPDYLAVYTFNTSDASWVYFTKFTSGTKQAVLNWTDGWFVIFDSDYSAQYEGFALGAYYDSC